MKRRFTRYSLLISLIIISSCRMENQAEEVYLFSYFINEKDGMYLAVSEDGLDWHPLNNNQPVLKSYVGDSLLRDPSLVQDKTGRFHLVFTTSWTNLGFGYTSSADLVNWDKQQFIPIDKGSLSDGVRNAWAPELYYEEEDDEFYMIWASAKTRIPTLKSGFKGDHKQYYIKTQDFNSFTRPELFYNGHFSDKAIIDTYVLDTEDEYYFFYKVEATNLEDGGKDGIHFMSAPSLDGPYSESHPIPNARGNSEGPAVTKVGDDYIIYYDAPRGAARSTDLQNWKDISELVNYPENSRHGSVLKIDKSIVEKSFMLPFENSKE